MNPPSLDLVSTFVQQHPEAAARELEHQSQEAAGQLVRALPLNVGRLLLSHMLPPYAARLCAEVSPDRAAGLLAEHSANQISALLRCIPKSKRGELLAALPENTATRCRLLMAYSEDTVGAWMTADIVMLSADSLAAEALQHITQTDGLIMGDRLPVLGQGHQLVGLVYIRDLLRAKADTPVSRLLHESPGILSSRASLVSASHHEAWQSYDTLAVHNRERQLVGLLRYADLRHSLEQFNEASSSSAQDNLMVDIGEAYGSTFVALLGLLEGPTSMGKN